MHVNLLDVYQSRQGWVHQMDPRVKILGALLFILTTVTLPEGAWIAQAMLLCLVLLLSWRAQLGIFFTVRRAFIALPFLLAALPLPFLIPGSAIWVVPGLGWTMTLPGLTRFLTIVLRTWIAVQAGIFLSATTAMNDLLWGLRALRVPRLLVSIVGFMVRYLFVLVDEAMRMMRARAARSPVLPGVRSPGLIWQGRMAGMMVGSLFIRSLERSERVHEAMLSRGYDGEMRMVKEPAMSGLDWLSLAVTLSLLLFVLCFSLWS